MTAIKTRPVPADFTWPSGDSWLVASLRLRPEDAERRFGCAFSPVTADDLGDVREAALLDDGVGVVAMAWRPQRSDLGVMLDVDLATPRQAVLDWLGRAGLTREDIDWLDPREHSGRGVSEGSAGLPLVLVIHGPAGAGKDALAKRLLDSGRFRKAVSTTSRPARPGEVEGVDYYFVSEDQFRALVAQHAFAEWFWVHGQGKGVTWDEVRRLLAAGHDFIIKTDVNGARHWRAALAGGIDIVILPADPHESIAAHRAVLAPRMRHREPDIDPAEMERRLDDAEAEVVDALNANYVIVNRDGHLAEAEAALDRLVERERVNRRRVRPQLRT